MKHFLIVALSLIVAIQMLSAQDAAAYFIGKIDGKFEVQVDLQKQGDQVTGSYYYSRIGKEIRLKGKITPDFKLILTEYLDGNQPGATFSGQLSKDAMQYNGQWQSADKAKMMEFQLQRVAYYHFIEMEKDAVTTFAAYPAFDDPALHNLNQQLLDSARSRSTWFIKQMTAALETQDYSPAHGMERSITFDINYYAPPLISMTVNLWEYTGGAHGNYTFAPATVNVDSEQIQWLKLDNLFAEDSDYRRLIARLGLEQLRDVPGTFANEGMEVSADLADIGTFSLLKNGLQLTFAPYQVAPYAAGTFKILIPYQELKSYWKQSAITDLLKTEG